MNSLTISVVLLMLVWSSHLTFQFGFWAAVGAEDSLATLNMDVVSKTITESDCSSGTCVHAWPASVSARSLAQSMRDKNVEAVFIFTAPNNPTNQLAAELIDAWQEILWTPTSVYFGQTLKQEACLAMHIVGIFVNLGLFLSL
jgi:hypothetical protein